MHKIIDQIKLLMVRKFTKKGKMRGKYGEKFNEGKKTNEGEINQMWGKN